MLWPMVGGVTLTAIASVALALRHDSAPTRRSPAQRLGAEDGARRCLVGRINRSAGACLTAPAAPISSSVTVPGQNPRARRSSMMRPSTTAVELVVVGLSKCSTTIAPLTVSNPSLDGKRRPRFARSCQSPESTVQ